MDKKIKEKGKKQKQESDQTINKNQLKESEIRDDLIHKKVKIDPALQAYETLIELSFNPETIQTSNQTNESLKILENYNKTEKKVIFSEDLFSSQDRQVLTPHIFTKKYQYLFKTQKNMPPHIIAFENYLHLVTQLYYKKKFNLNELLVTFNQVSTIENTDNQIPIKSSRGRKAKVKNIQTNEPLTEIEKEEEIETKEEENDISLLSYDILDTLISPIRSTLVYEKWSPLEIAIFESGVCKFGKQFVFIKYMIQTKSLQDCIEFYQIWKLSSHYKTWKYYKNLINKNNHNIWL